jgi:hypothetical protein
MPKPIVNPHTKQGKCSGARLTYFTDVILRLPQSQMIYINMAIKTYSLFGVGGK